MKPSKRWAWLATAIIAVTCGAGYLTYRGSHTLLRPAPFQPPLTASSGDRGGRALLVGCGRYVNPSIRPLEGPANDVRLMKEVLVKHCGFSPGEITTLAGDAPAGDAPTRANIEREFRRLRDVAQAGDQIIVLLAGHGSQQPNQAADLEDHEPDGLDEIFLPIDTQQWSGSGGNGASGGVVNAIIDDEIYRWTAAIAEKGAAVWIIFDCCCAGTAIRGGYQETARFVSAAGDLSVPAATLPALESDEAHWELVSRKCPPRNSASVSDRLVAFYACQAHESELELALPPAKNDANVQRAKHGLLTYALCSSLSQPASKTLTYRDLARDVWLRYRAWGRGSPTPFVDGAVDRQVLGERQRSTRFRVVRRSGREGVIDAGALEGLTPGSIVAIYPPTAAAAKASDGAAGYARVTHVQPTTARIVPCAYGQVNKAIAIEPGARCELVYADFGDMRLALAIDQKSAAGMDQTAEALAQLAEQLRALADLPTAVFTVVDQPSTADWVVQARESAIELLPRSAAEMADGEPLPLGTPRLSIDDADSPEAIAGLLQRIFRAQNLIKLAAGCGSVVAKRSTKIKVEFLLQSEPLSDGALLHPGQQVEWKITNEGTAALDLTLLFIDSELAIAAAFPRPDQLLADNRLAPGECLRQAATVRGNTLGTEHLVAIATRARGPQRDFRCLAGPSFAAAQSLAAATRGGEQDIFESPLGRLMRYALYNDQSLPGTTRGLTSSSADDCALSLRAWVVAPNDGTRGQE